MAQLAIHVTWPVELDLRLDANVGHVLRSGNEGLAQTRGKRAERRRIQASRTGPRGHMRRPMEEARPAKQHLDSERRVALLLRVRAGVLALGSVGVGRRPYGIRTAPHGRTHEPQRRPAVRRFTSARPMSAGTSRVRARDEGVPDGRVRSEIDDGSLGEVPLSARLASFVTCLGIQLASVNRIVNDFTAQRRDGTPPGQSRR